MGALNGSQAEVEEAPPSLSRTGREMGQVCSRPSSMPIGTPRSKAAALKERISSAHLVATRELRSPMTHACLSLSGLFVVQGIRLAAWQRGELPVATVSMLHALSASSDLSTITCCLPLIVDNSSEGRCVRWGCVGPVVTLLVTMVLLDFVAMAAALAMQPYPVLPPHTGTWSLAFFQATFGAWNCSLVASFSLQVSLCACCWRVYKGLRVTGLYPPNSDALERGTTLPKHDEVSPLEMFCENEEVQLLNNAECKRDFPFTNLCSHDADGARAASQAPRPLRAPLEELQISRHVQSYAEASRSVPREDETLIANVGRRA